MRIYPVTKVQNNKNYRNLPSNNVNFKSLETFLVYLVAKQGVAALKSTKKIKYLNQLEDGLMNKYSQDVLAESLKAISKTPDSFYDYHHQGWTLWLGGIYGREPEYVDTLRYRALFNFPSLSDSSRVVVQTKKEFLQSFFENGHEISETFLNVFKNLRDDFYGSFKQGIIDTCLYSQSYNKIREMKDVDNYCFPRECNPFFFGRPFRDYDMRDIDDPAAKKLEKNRISLYSNLKLISTLDKKVHGNYIEQRRNAIENMKSVLEKFFNEKFTQYEERKNCELYREFLTVIKTI
ncbi:hypothetical protein IKQ21_08340 [bacterium]|nr:hypothetical protein [bacterium]